MKAKTQFKIGDKVEFEGIPGMIISGNEKFGEWEVKFNNDETLWIFGEELEIIEPKTI